MTRSSQTPRASSHRASTAKRTTLRERLKRAGARHPAALKVLAVLVFGGGVWLLQSDALQAAMGLSTLRRMNAVVGALRFSEPSNDAGGAFTILVDGGPSNALGELCGTKNGFSYCVRGTNAVRQFRTDASGRMNLGTYTCPTIAQRDVGTYVKWLNASGSPTGQYTSSADHLCTGLKRGTLTFSESQTPANASFSISADGGPANALGELCGTKNGLSYCVRGTNSMPVFRADATGHVNLGRYTCPASEQRDVGTYLKWLNASGSPTGQTTPADHLCAAPIVGNPQVAETERQVAKLFLQYDTVDFSAVKAMMLSDPLNEGNSNYGIMFTSLAAARLLAFGESGDAAMYDRALTELEWLASNHGSWGWTWASGPAAAHVAFTSRYAMKLARDGGNTAQVARAELLWARVQDILAAEANMRLKIQLPFTPFDSTTFNGDSKAEENAWEASLFSAAVNFVPQHPNVAQWEAKAKELAYDSLIRPVDPAYPGGVKVSTMTDDYILTNHWLPSNPYYEAGTLHLLSQGALPYRLLGKVAPAEFLHNVPAFLAKYKTHVGGDATTGYTWTIPADPIGDPTLMPLVFDPAFEKQMAEAKLRLGYLWKPGTPPAVIPGNRGSADLVTAMQNGKVALYYLVGMWWNQSPW